jgi:uncharacterized protein (UPF0332 family)
MNEEARLYLLKAVESLSGAESEFSAGRFNNGANRCYYACFQAAIAALIEAGIRPPRDEWGHDYVQSQFVGLLVRRRQPYPSDVSNTLQQAMFLRHIADYSTHHISADHCCRTLRRSQHFVAIVRER